jgi:hypothetical protein
MHYYINMIPNLLSSNEIAEILNNPIVQTNKEKLSTLDKVDFSIQLPDAIKAKLETGFGINLSQITSIPMRWIKGDTVPHIDRGENHFNNTYLLYLTDSVGNLIIDGQSYPITAGDAHIFNEGLAHSTINTGDSERLMIGPMSETGFRVGISYSIIYFNNEIDAIQGAVLDDYGNPNMTNAIGFNDYDDYLANNQYKIKTVTDISSWYIATSAGGVSPPSPNGGPYTAGTALNPGARINEPFGIIYYLYPSTPPTPPTPPTRPASMGSLFTNNAQVYYKPGSLSTGGGGSGVRNCRHKQRKT